ncbi:MAG: hypothetical protein R3E79_25080 [Caldilineaceae bacterium]
MSGGVASTMTVTLLLALPLLAVIAAVFTSNRIGHQRRIDNAADRDRTTPAGTATSQA